METYLSPCTVEGQGLVSGRQGLRSGKGTQFSLCKGPEAGPRYHFSGAEEQCDCGHCQRETLCFILAPEEDTECPVRPHTAAQEAQASEAVPPEP